MSKLYNLQHLLYALLRGNDLDCDLSHASQKAPDFFLKQIFNSPQVSLHCTGVTNDPEVARRTKSRVFKLDVIRPGRMKALEIKLLLIDGI